MALKTMVAAGLTSVALAGGAAWGYIHYAEIFGGGCCTSSCEPAPSCSATADTESCCESEQPTATPNCCDAPSRASILSQD